MATDQCGVYQFKSPFFPGSSCEEIYTNNPESRDRSGYYWITDGPRKVYCGMTYTGSSCEDIYNNHPETNDKPGDYRINNDQWTYCNMTAIAFSNFIPTCAGITGGWRRIANVNITSGGDCPSGWRKESHSNISYCRINAEGVGCTSAYFSTNGTSYQRVCGRARGYQKGVTQAFRPHHFAGQRTIDSAYADSLSITYNSPRQHIWSFVSSLTDDSSYNFINCPCSYGGGLTSPSFVGNQFYCEAGAISTWTSDSYYLDDPLWDGNSCHRSTTCCSNTTQPWFYRQLSVPTSSDVEARICCGHGGFAERAVLIDQFELYIQ